jgi:hypothetical protein
MSARRKVSDAWAVLWRADRLSAIGLVLLATLILLGLFGPYLPLGDATKIAGPRLTPRHGGFHLAPMNLDAHSYLG